MKKFYLLLVILLSSESFAQITITSTDLPQQGWGFINGNDTAYNAAIPAGGASQSWNYSSLVNNKQDSLLFLNATGTPYAGTFTSANLAVNDPQEGIWAYFISNSTGLYLNGGTVPGFGGALVNNPPEMLIPAPFTYMSTYNGYARAQYDTTLLGYPTRIVRYRSVAMLGDGYGSLVLPTGTFNNTLRIKTTVLETDSVYQDYGFGYQPAIGFTPIQTQTTNFKWLRNGGGTLLLEIEADSLGQTGNHSQYMILFAIVSVNEVAGNSSAVIYPIPADEWIQIDFSYEQPPGNTLNVYDAAGKFIATHLHQSGRMFRLPVTNLESGIYFFELKTKQGVSERKKFVVMH